MEMKRIVTEDIPTRGTKAPILGTLFNAAGGEKPNPRR